MATQFRNRTEAGRLLSHKLLKYANRRDVIVLALPRGGVPVAYEVAKVLNAPLEVFLVHKLGLPGQEELAMGAIASGGIRILNDTVIEAFGVSDRTVDQVAGAAQKELEDRERLYRGDRPMPDIRERTLILIDDGLATGSTMRAAVAALRQQHPARIVVAVPTAASQTCKEFETEVDEIICAQTPEPFVAVGMWYRDFAQTTHQEVHDLLERAAQERRLVEAER
jgi:putative phosphoribosyl transferase